MNSDRRGTLTRPTLSIAQHPQVAASPDLDGALRVGGAGGGRGAGLAGLTHRVGEGEQVVRRRARVDELPGQTHDLPAPRRGQPLGVLGAQVVGVWLGVGGQRTQDRGLVGIDVGQGRDGSPGTGGAGTLARQTHGGTVVRGAPAANPARRNVVDVSSPRPPRRRRNRHGRGPRGPLAWPPVPAMQTRAERFDDLVLDAASRLEERVGEAFGEVEFAVEDVPPSDPAPWEPADIALGRLFAARGRMPARIVIYRRPVETRVDDPRELAALVNEVVVEQVAAMLGVDPAELDPGWDVGPDDGPL